MTGVDKLYFKFYYQYDIAGVAYVFGDAIFYFYLAVWTDLQGITQSQTASLITISGRITQ